MPRFLIKIDITNLAGCDEELEIDADNETDAQDQANDIAMETFAPFGEVICEI